MRSNLVIVRAGDQSLHPRWLDPSADRNWDLLVGYYADHPESTANPDGKLFLEKGGKFDCIAHVLDQQPELFGKYETFWLPDDDIVADQASINELFETMREFQLELAQPSLTPD